MHGGESAGRDAGTGEQAAPLADANVISGTWVNGHWIWFNQRAAFARWRVSPLGQPVKFPARSVSGGHMPATMRTGLGGNARASIGGHVRLTAHRAPGLGD